MSTVTDVADALGGMTQLPVESERQVLVRVQRGGILIGERELRYQLQRKDDHPLAQADELLDVLAEMKARGLIEAEMCFRLTERGRVLLAGPGASGRAGS